MTWRIVGAADLFEDHFAFARNLLFVEDRIANGVCEHVEPVAPPIRRQGGVVDRRVEGRIGVDLSAESLDVACDGANGSPFSALEEHVLVEVGEAFLTGPFVGGADVGPDLELYDGRAMAFAKQDRQAVFEHLFVGAENP